MSNITNAFNNLIADLEVAFSALRNLQDVLDEEGAPWWGYLMDEKNNKIDYLIREFIKYKNDLK